MTINERIKIARKSLNLTQIEFGNKVGISQGHLTSIESGKRTVTDKSVIVICATFGINEEWLRNGTEPMFIESDSTIISQLADEYDLDVYEKAMISSFLKLKPEQRQFVRNWIKNAMNEINTKQNIEATSEIAPPIPNIQQDVMSKLAEMEQQNKKLLARLEVLEKEEDEWEKEQMKQSVFPTRPHF